MNKTFALRIFLLFGCCFHSFGQRCNYKLEGFVYDSKSNKPLFGANVWIEKYSKGVSSREDGSFVLSELCDSKFNLKAHFIGYSEVSISIDLSIKKTINIFLSPEKEVLEEVLIKKRRESNAGLQQLETISSEDISEQIGKGLSDIIKSVSGVNVLKTGSGISKPIIHGLSGNRVQLLNNEIPQSGQYWGNDHAPEIEPSIADHISVVKGASALMYGSSLGGVVLVEPGKIPNDSNFHGRISHKFDSNGLASSSNIKIEKSNPSYFDWRISSSYKEYGDRKASDYFLTNTGNKEISFALQLQKKFKKSWNGQAYYSLYNSEIGILRGSIIGNTTDLGNALSQNIPFFTSEKFSYSISAPRQEVQHHLAKAKIIYEDNDDFNISFTYGGQLDNRKEFDVRRRAFADMPSLSIQQFTHYFESHLKWFIANNKKINAGVQATIIDNKNDNEETGVLPLIPDYESNKIGAFFIWKQELSPVQYELGIRYDRIGIDANVISNSLPRIVENFKPKFNNLSFSSGFQWDISPNLETTLNIGYVSRSPEPNELYSTGLHQGVSRIEMGNQNLGNEKSFKSTLSLKWDIDELFSIHLSPYYQRIEDFIFLDQQPNLKLTIRGAFLEYQYAQADARFSGLDAFLQFKPSKRWTIEGKYSKVDAINLENKDPLPFIPTDKLSTDIKVSLNDTKRLKNSEIRLSFDHVWQASSKNTEFFRDLTNNRTIEVRPPKAYSLVHLRGQTKYHWKDQSIKLWVSIENILNQKYRDYLDRHRYFADALGRSIQLGLQFEF